MVPTSTSNIYQVLDSLHLLWMGRWIHHHAEYLPKHLLVRSDLFCELKSWVTAGLLMILGCRDWGSQPTWDDPLIRFQHIHSVWKTIICCGWEEEMIYLYRWFTYITSISVLIQYDKQICIGRSPILMNDLPWLKQHIQPFESLLNLVALLSRQWFCRVDTSDAWPV
jgi:hypothetical protein